MPTEQIDEFDAVRINDHFWLINGRLIPAVSGSDGTAPPPKEDEEAAKAKALEEEKRFNDRVNAAVTARTKRLEEQFNSKFDEIKKMLTPAPAVEDEDEDEEDPPADPPAPGKASEGKVKKVDPTAKKALALAKKAQEEAATERKKREELEQRRATDEERSTTKSALEDAGCTGALQRAAMAVLKEDGRIGRDSDGNLVFKTSKKIHGETIVEEETLQDGIKAWLGTDEGKNYLPPKGTEGSGASRGGAAILTGKNSSKADRKAAAGRVLLDFAMRR